MEALDTVEPRKRFLLETTKMNSLLTQLLVISETLCSPSRDVATTGGAEGKAPLKLLFTPRLG